MTINGTLYTFTKVPGGYEIAANGEMVGWSAGSLADARTVAWDIARSAA